MIKIKKLTTCLKHTHFWIEAKQGEALIGHTFFIVRMPLSLVPEFCRPEHDGRYAYIYSDHFIGLEPCERSVKTGWNYQLEAVSRGNLTLTERIDLVERSKYRVLLEENGSVHWISNDFIAIVGSNVRFELGAEYAVRVYAPGNETPIAVLSERTERK